MPATFNLTANFDSGVNNIIMEDSSHGISLGTIYTSGESVPFFRLAVLSGTINLNNGYKVKSIVSESLGNIDFTDNTFSCSLSDSDTITITTQLSTTTYLFKHFKASNVKIGTGTIKFKQYNILGQPSGEGGKITLPMLDAGVYPLEEVTDNNNTFSGTPCFYSEENNARVIQVGAKGYTWLSKVNSGEEIVSLEDMVNAFGVTETNKGNTIIPSEWDFFSSFVYRLIDDNGADGGSMISWGARLEGLASLTLDDIILLKYNATYDTLTPIELDDYDAAVGSFTVSEEVDFNDILAIAIRITD